MSYYQNPYDESGYGREAVVEFEPEVEFLPEVLRGEEPEEERLPAPKPVPRAQILRSSNPAATLLAAVLALAVAVGVATQGQSATMPSTAGQVAPAGQVNPLAQPGPAPLTQPGPQGLPQPGPVTLPQAPQGGSSIPPSQPPIKPPVEPMPKNPILPEATNVRISSVAAPCSTINLYHCQDLPLNARQMTEVNSARVDVIDFLRGGWHTIDINGLKDNLSWYGSNYGFTCSGNQPSVSTRMWEILHPSKMVGIALTPAQIQEMEGVQTLILDITPKVVKEGDTRDWTKALPLDFSYGQWDKLYEYIKRTPLPANVRQMSLRELVERGYIIGFVAKPTRDSRLNFAVPIGIVAPAHLKVWVDFVNDAYPGILSRWSRQETLLNGPYGNLPADRTPIQILSMAPDEPRPPDFGQGISGRPMTILATWHVQRLDAQGKVIEEAMWGIQIVAHY